MVKSAEYWNGNNAVIIRNVVPLDLKLDCPGSEVWDSWPETRVRTSSIVMIRPLLQDLMNIRGTRITVSVVLNNLAEGLSSEEIVKEYPPLTLDDIRAAISYAANSTREEEILPLR